MQTYDSNKWCKDEYKNRHVNKSLKILSPCKNKRNKKKIGERNENFKRKIIKEAILLTNNVSKVN